MTKQFLLFGKKEIKSANGVILEFGPLTLYWQKKIDAPSIWQEKIDHIFNIFFNVILVMIVITGISNLLLAAWQVSWHFDIEFLTAKEILPFWISILAFTYLIFKIQTAIKPVPVIVPKSFQDDAHQQLLSQQINVAKSLNRDTLLTLENSWQIAKDYKLAEVDTRCLLLAILHSRKLTGVLARLGLVIGDVSTRVENALASTAGTVRQTPILSDQVVEIILQAYKIAAEKRVAWVGIPYVLLAMVAEDVRIQDIFADMEIDNDKLAGAVSWLAVNEQLGDWYKRYRKLAAFKPKNSMNRSMTAVATPYLDKFSHDLTLAARYGNLELTVGRQKEIDEIFRVIESGTDSVVLVGFPGVGKTAIIEGIAQRMVTEDVPPILQDKRLVSLSLPRLVAGASSPGMLEERLLNIHQEIVRATNVVLVVENIHDVYGINTQGGEGLDLSEVMAEVIKDTRFIVLASSSPTDYRKSIAGKALGGVLQKIEVMETDKVATMEILAAKVNHFEAKYQIFFSYDALSQAIDLSARYLHDYWLPEKAIKILEEVAVYVRKQRGEKQLASGNDVAALLSEKVHIPLTKLTEDESDKLLHLEDEIHKYLINQEEAVQSVSSALRRARTELRDVARPIVNLLFLGPTGVGKTELAKTVALVYFGSKENMIRLDMSEYQDKVSIGRLIGTQADPTAGLLTNAVKQDPYTVLLLDEIEKANPDILNIFLQVMDDGRLTDWSGGQIDFTNTIIIATSNAGADYIQEAIRDQRPIAAIKEVLLREKLKGIFRPEFLNRFDNTVVFKTLTEEHIRQVAGLMLKKSQERLMQKGIHLEVTSKALAELAAAGFDPAFGARPMRRVIQEKVDDALAKFLLSGKITRRDVVVMEAGGKIRVEKAERYI